MATEQMVMAVISASRPTFRNRNDKIVYVIHAAFLSSGYVLNATGSAAMADDALSSTSSDEVGMENWNEFEEDYAFVYSKREKPTEKVLVKCIVMNEKVLVSALKETDPKHLEIDVEKYTTENEGRNYHEQYKDLGKLLTELDKEILGKFSKSSNSSATGKTSSSENRGSSDNTPLFSGTSDSRGGFSFNPSGVYVPPVPAFGGSDLFPGPGAGMYPQRGGFGQGSGSMLVGPNDPHFFGGRGDPSFPGLGGAPGVPPGARFDPYGPPGLPGFEPGRFVGNPNRPGGGTHPDLQHFGSGSGDFI